MTAWSPTESWRKLRPRSTRAGNSPALTCLSALDNIQRQSSLRRFLVAALHVESGAVHRLDDLVERNFVRPGFVHGDAARVHRLHRAHGVTLDAGNLHQPANRIAGHAKIMFHGNFSGMLLFRIASAHRRN